MASQITVVRLEENLARAMRAWVSSRGSGYRSIDEFVEVAIRNQMALQCDSTPALASSMIFSDGSSPAPVLLAQPTHQLGLGFASPPRQAAMISPLTNRLSPLKIALRVLCNLTTETEWPTIHAFHHSAALCARHLGERLRTDETARGVRGAERRSTAFPCGHNERKSLDRFIAHFTTAKRTGSTPGPLETLGLAVLNEDRIELSADGWALGIEASPLLGECAGSTLSEAERKLLLLRVASVSGEAQAIREVLRTIKRAAGNQRRVDELITLAHSSWTPALAISHRAAIVGRIRELGLVDLKGRGAEARLLLTAAGESWLKSRLAKEPI